MRIQAPCARPWQVYHCTQARMLTHVVWVDDVLRQWCDIDMPMRPMGDGVAKTVHQANAIRIMVDRGLVLIDPIADVDGVKDSIEVETLRFIGAPNAYERAAREFTAPYRAVPRRLAYRLQDALQVADDAGQGQGIDRALWASVASRRGHPPGRRYSGGSGG